MYDFNYMKKLIKNIANNKIKKDDAFVSLKENSAYIEEIKNLGKKIVIGLL